MAGGVGRLGHVWSGGLHPSSLPSRAGRAFINGAGQRYLRRRKVEGGQGMVWCVYVVDVVGVMVLSF